MDAIRRMRQNVLAVAISAPAFARIHTLPPSTRNGRIARQIPSITEPPNAAKRIPSALPSVCPRVNRDGTGRRCIESTRRSKSNLNVSLHYWKITNKISRTDHVSRTMVGTLSHSLCICYRWGHSLMHDGFPFEHGDSIPNKTARICLASVWSME